MHMRNISTGVERFDLGRALRNLQHSARAFLERVVNSFGATTMIEYRNTDGSQIEVAANGHLSTPKKVDLRSLGCPDWLASKVEGAREVRRPAPATLAAAPLKITAT